MYVSLIHKTSDFSTLAGVSLITRRVSAFMRPSSVLSFRQLAQSMSRLKPIISHYITVVPNIIPVASESLCLFS
jgi:hypothetical protein